MRHASSFGKDIDEILESSAEIEELKLPNGEFVAKNCKAFKMLMLIASIVSIALGLILAFFVNDYLGYLFLILGFGLFLMLPTILSYKCVINKTFVAEEYFVLFFKRRKKIFWDDVKYKKIVVGDNKRIKLYNEKKKCLIVFDGSTVGFNRISKMVKRYSIIDIGR